MDKEASQNSGVKHLLFAVDIFFAICPSSNNENKISQRHRHFASFPKKILDKYTPQKIWVDKRTEYRGIFKKICMEKDIEVHSILSETKAAFAESAIQSLKHIIYLHIEDHGEKFIPKLPHFVSIRNCHVLRSIGKSAKDVKNTDLKKDTSHNLQIKILKVRQYLQNSLQHTRQIFKDLDKEEILGTFIGKELRKCADSR